MASKPMPLAIMLSLDTVLIAGSLLTFAYFHHVKPKDLVNNPEEIKHASIPVITSTTPALTTEATEWTTTQSQSLTEDETQSATEGTETTVASGSDETNTDTTTSISGTDNAQQSGTSQTTTSTSKTTQTTTTSKPLTYDTSGWGSKWPTIFSLGNEIEKTEYSYRSHDCYIQINPITYIDSNCYVADIYIRDIRNFTYAFAKDEFKQGVAENVMSMIDRHNAILAINGDYFGVRDNGCLIRDGACYRDTPRGDVAALYYDGRVETYSKDEFDVDTALAEGIWQSFAFGPNLVRNGVVQSGWTSSVYASKHPRSGFGYYEPGHYCFVAVDGRGMGGSAGLTAEEFACLFGDLGCYQAYNLDGGKSTQLLFDGRVINLPDGYNGESNSLRGLTDIFLIKEVQ